jgi:Ser/Thr protein kinase RdoA (MazF antagonist)
MAGYRVRSILVKWRHVPFAAQARVSARLAALRANPPAGVPPLHSYGWLAQGGAGSRLRLSLGLVSGVPLAVCLPALGASTRLEVSEALRALLESWRKVGFVHGDLSPRNILVDVRRAEVWCIDWILDLKGFEATPRYAAPAVFQGRRSHDTDRFALAEILKSWEE